MIHLSAIGISNIRNTLQTKGLYADLIELSTFLNVLLLSPGGS